MGLKTWAIEMDDGTLISVPSRIRSNYDRIDLYGHQAILERVKRTRAYKKAAQDGQQIRAILFPHGERVTQF